MCYLRIKSSARRLSTYEDENRLTKERLSLMRCFPAIYQIVFVLAVYYLHDASGETIMYYAFPDISQLEGMGISPALSVLFYVMIIAALFWPVVMLGIIRRAIAPERAGRTAAIAGHLFSSLRMICGSYMDHK